MECAVRPPGNSRAAMPVEAVQRPSLPLALMSAARAHIVNVFPDPAGASIVKMPPLTDSTELEITSNTAFCSMLSLGMRESASKTNVLRIDDGDKAIKFSVDMKNRWEYDRRRRFSVLPEHVVNVAQSLSDSGRVRHSHGVVWGQVIGVGVPKRSGGCTGNDQSN